MPTNTYHRILLLLKVATASVFAGRAWQHLFWDPPYRELLWDDRYMKAVVEALTPWTWDEYVTNLAVDEAIQTGMICIGLFYSCCAVLTFFVETRPKLVRPFLWLGSVGLVVLSLLYMKEFFFHIGQFFEYTLQFSAPLFLMAVAKKKEVTPRLVLWMKLAIALTFACHGLYSLGYYPRPGSFVSMTMRTLFFSEPQSIGFLKLVGLLDFVVAVGIFLPGRWSRHFLLYAAIWGLATSLARITGNFYAAYFVSSLHQWVHEAVFRLPHALVPLAVYTLERAVRPSPTNIKSTGSPIA